MSDSMVTTPTEGATSVQVESDTDKTEVVVQTDNVESKADDRDFAAELSSKDHEIATMRQQLDAVGDDKAAKERLSLELATAISARQDVAKERDEAIASRSKAIDTMTKATESLIDSHGDLERRLAEYERQVEEEKSERASLLGKLTKFEVLTKEFAHLLPYADRILNSEDPEKVRADAKAFSATRESDLDTYKRLVSGTQQLPTGASTTPENPVLSDDSDERMEQLRRAMKEGPREFEKMLENMKSGYEQSRALTA